MPRQKRDNKYYLLRLKKDRPDLHREVQAGRMTVNKARQIAGLGATRTRLTELKHAWKTATHVERSQFLSWAGLTSPPAVPPVSSSAFDAEGFMLDWVRRRIPEIMQRRNMSFGDVADELGVRRMNPSVMNAVRNDTRINSAATAAAIETWLAKNASV